MLLATSLLFEGPAAGVVAGFGAEAAFTGEFGLEEEAWVGTIGCFWGRSRESPVTCSSIEPMLNASSGEEKVSAASESEGVPLWLAGSESWPPWRAPLLGDSLREAFCQYSISIGMRKPVRRA